MPNTEELLGSFRKKVCNQIDIEPVGVGRYIIYTPFMFDDGDHFVSVLRREQDRWFISDEGHTLMHMDYGNVDITKGARARLFEEALVRHGLQNVEGELRIEVPDEAFGDALFSYLQAITQAVHVGQFTQERTKSAFMDDFHVLLQEIVPEDRREFDWHDPGIDPDEHYAVDCRIATPGRPTFVFAVNSNDKCQNATIKCLWYERMQVPFHSVAIFEKQEDITRKPLARLSDVVDKQFASLSDTKRIEGYFRELMAAA